MEYCVSRGLQIASIHSQEDADSIEFLLAQTRSEILYNAGTGEERQGDDNAYFIGARAEMANGEFLQWEWEDGSPWDFEHRLFARRFQTAATDQTVHLLQVPGKGWEHTGGNFWVVGEYHPGNKFAVICGAPAPALDDFCSYIARNPVGIAWAVAVGACDGTNRTSNSGH